MLPDVLCCCHSSPESVFCMNVRPIKYQEIVVRSECLHFMNARPIKCLRIVVIPRQNLSSLSIFVKLLLFATICPSREYQAFLMSEKCIFSSSERVLYAVLRFWWDSLLIEEKLGETWNISYSFSYPRLIEYYKFVGIFNHNLCF